MKVDGYREGDWFDYASSNIEVHKHTDHLVLKTNKPLPVSELLGNRVSTALVADSSTSLIVIVDSNKYLTRVAVVPLYETLGVFYPVRWCRIFEISKVDSLKGGGNRLWLDLYYLKGIKQSWSSGVESSKLFGGGVTLDTTLHI